MAKNLVKGNLPVRCNLISIPISLSLVYKEPFRGLAFCSIDLGVAII